MVVVIEGSWETCEKSRPGRDAWNDSSISMSDRHESTKSMRAGELQVCRVLKRFT